ncbi:MULTISPECIES: DUF3558 family protein [unclassified Kutzneria]|uniref:DUF3558 family protein n=1 Tax=unclassified Kutzneria TaxID=2621979 RepID=UPI0004ACC5F0|nr:DUF3558 family protein [Kutzneria sp. 744]
MLVRGVSGLGIVLLAVVSLSACNGQPTQGQAEPTGASSSQGAGSSAALDKVDPCTLLTTDQLKQYNVETQGAPNNTSDETGCAYLGYPDSLTRGINVGKSKDSVDSFAERADTFVKFTKNSVNGRKGAQTQISTSNTECSQVMAVGSGTVRVGVINDKSGDPCGDVLKIAQVVEPKLPK